MTGELTAGEKAYLESGGTDTAGLLAENPTPVVAEASSDPVIHKIEPDTAAVAAPAATEVKAEPAAPAVAEAPEPGEEEIPAADGKTKRRMVDSRALKAERERARTLEAELLRERDTRARVDERLKMLSEAVTASEPAAQQVDAAPAIPDPEQDIFGYAKYLADELAAVKSTLAGTQADTAEQRQTAAMISTYERDAAAFKTKQPDFMDAYGFLINTRKGQLELQGYTPEDVNRWLYKEEADLVNRALQGKKSPSEQIYALAKSMGYAAKPAPVPAAAAPVASARAAAPAAPLTAPSVTDEIDRIKAGKAASMSLSNGGGGGAEELSLEWLANAPPKEFEAFMNKPGNREKVERAMGNKAA